MKHYITRKRTQLFDGKEKKWIFPRMKKSSVRKGKEVVKDIGLQQKEFLFLFFFFFTYRCYKLDEQNGCCYFFFFGLLKELFWNGFSRMKKSASGRKGCYIRYWSSAKGAFVFFTRRCINWMSKTVVLARGRGASDCVG